MKPTDPRSTPARAAAGARWLFIPDEATFGARLLTDADLETVDYGIARGRPSSISPGDWIVLRHGIAVCLGELLNPCAAVQAATDADPKGTA